MRLDISNLLVALLVVREVGAGPIRPVRHRRQEENLPECQPEQDGGLFGGGDGFGRIRDPQADPDPTPAPEICLLPSAGSDESDDETDAPSSDDPSETDTGAPEITETAGGSEEPTGAREGPVDEPSSEVVSETSAEERPPETPSSANEEPTDTPEGTTAETTPSQTDNSPVVSTEGPSSGVESETSAKGCDSETTSAEEPTATDSKAGDEASPTETGPEAGASGTLAGTGGGLTTVTVTVRPGDDNQIGTGASGAAPTAAPEEPSFISDVSSPESAPATSAQPPPSEAPSDSSPEPTITPTGTPNPDLPKEITSDPTATASVAPDVLEANIQRAKEVNEDYASLTPFSACSEGQVACVEGSIAKCNGGAFNLLPCQAGKSCMALPSFTMRSVVELKCVTEEEAAILGPGAFPSASPSESATQAPGDCASESPSESTQTLSESASEPPSESTQAPSQPADEQTTTVTQESTVTFTSIVTPTKELIFTSVLTGPFVPPSSEAEPVETPVQATEPGAVLPTTLAGTEPAETEAPSPSNPIVINPVDGPADNAGDSEAETKVETEAPQNVPVAQPTEVVISFDVSNLIAPFGPAATASPVGASERR